MVFMNQNAKFSPIKKFTIIICLIFLFTSIFSAFFIYNVSAEEYGVSDPSYPYGTWLIDENTRVENQNILMNGSIHITNGTTYFENTIIRFNNNATSGQFNLWAYESGNTKTEVYFNNCIIKAENPNYPFAMLFYPVSDPEKFSPKVEFTNTKIQNNGGLTISSNGTYQIKIKNCTFLNNGEAIRLVNAESSIVENCTFTNNNQSIILFESQSSMIKNNQFFEDYDESIEMICCNRDSILNNLFVDCENSGLILSNCNHTIIANNTFDSCEKSALIIGGNSIHGESDENNNNTIINNEFYDNEECGIKLRYTNRNQLINNTFEHNFVYGIWTYGASFNNISGNIMEDNLRYGIYLESSSIDNNIEYNQFIRNQRYGITYDCSSRNNTYIGNYFYANENGEILEPDCENGDDGKIDGFSIYILSGVSIILISLIIHKRKFQEI